MLAGQNSGWHPYGRAPPRGVRSRSSSTGRTAAIVIVVLLLLGGVAGGLAYYFMTRTPTDGATTNTTTADSNEVKFLPFGPSVNDVEASSNDVISYTVPGGVTFTMLGANNGSTPVGVEPKVGRGAVFVGVMESGTMSSTEVVKILVHGAKDIRAMDTILGEHFYYREATNSDKTFIDCLIPGYEAAYAYVFTWEKVVAYDSSTNIYTRIGTFQAVLAFDTNSTIYAVRSYASNVQDAVGASGQFKTYEASTDMRYDVNLVAADIRNKRLITPYSETPSGLTLTQLPDNKNCVPS